MKMKADVDDYIKATIPLRESLQTLVNLSSNLYEDLTASGAAPEDWEEQLAVIEAQFQTVLTAKWHYKTFESTHEEI